MLLQIDQCGIQFGGLKALSDFSLALGANDFVGLIGPNGAGKTTLFNLLTGVYEPTKGEITFDDRRLNGLKPHQISRYGIARTFQNIRLFGELTVEENVLVAVRGGRYAEARELLRIFTLSEQRDEIARNLPYGDQRRLEIVRALATHPKLLLLDEPAAGMNPTEKRRLIELIGGIHRDYGIAILLIEHDMSVVMTLCPRIVVLDYGEIIASGSPEEIRRNPRVIEAYLGVAADV